MKAEAHFLLKLRNPFCISARERFVVLFAMLFVLLCSSQSLYAQKKTRIDILHSELLLYEKSSGDEYRRLIGDVCFKHEGVLMYCDSAHFFDTKNEVQAFGHIHLIQGDSIHLYGSFMKYLGDLKLAQIRDQVHLTDDETTLDTDFLDFNLNTNTGTYYNGGIIHDGDNTLQSKKGSYDTKEEVFFYKDSVVIVNPDYTIYCDTLRYDTPYSTAYFLSPTRIMGEDTEIYCEDGWYNTELGLSQFNRNASLTTEDQILRGDSIFYDQNNEFGKGIGNVSITDTTEHLILYGQFAEYFKEPERSMVTDSALLIHYAETDSLFMHADTLRSLTDSLGTRLLLAYHNVRAYRSDFQSICDSISFSFSDSVIRMHNRPVVWLGENQITSEFIQVFTRNRKIDRVETYRSSLIVSENDSGQYNQIGGKDMIGYFRDGEMYMVRVLGNGQSVYYAKDEETLIGINKVICSNIVIFIEDREIKRIRFLNAPEGNFYPPFHIPEEEMLLKGFVWWNLLRPKDPLDIYRKNE